MHQVLKKETTAQREDEEKTKPRHVTAIDGYIHTAIPNWLAVAVGEAVRNPWLYARWTPRISQALRERSTARRKVLLTLVEGDTRAPGPGAARIQLEAEQALPSRVIPRNGGEPGHSAVEVLLRCAMLLPDSDILGVQIRVANLRTTGPSGKFFCKTFLYS